MSYIIGIDQSYASTGFCVIDNENHVVEFGTMKSDKQATMYDRALTLALCVCSLINKYNSPNETLEGIRYNPPSVNMEGLAFGIRGDATRDLAGLLFTIINVIKLKHEMIEVNVYAPTSLKKFATGSGKADKKMMFEHLPALLSEAILKAGFKKTTGMYDVCDAYWLAMIKK